MNFLSFFTSLFVLFIGTSVLAQETSNSTNAPVTENNPIRVTFQAVLQVGKPVQGQLTGVSNDNGTGVNFNINFFQFPDVALGPFSKSFLNPSSLHLPIRLSTSQRGCANWSDHVNVDYHVHEYPVPSSGNCTAAGGHLSPFGRLDTPPCDSEHPETCQPGDLSGKHGNISQLTSSTAPDGGGDTNIFQVASFQAKYLELYLSTDPNNAVFFGNRSVVVHAANGTRLNCANFTQMMPTSSFGAGNGSGNATTTGTAGSSTPTHNNAISGLEVIKTQAFLALGVVAVAAFVLL